MTGMRADMKRDIIDIINIIKRGMEPEKTARKLGMVRC